MLVVLLMVITALAGSEAEDLLLRGQLGTAIEVAQADAQEHPGDISAQELWIDIMLTAGQAPQTAARYTEWTRIRPEDPDAHYLVGRATLDPEASREAYEIALRLRPNHARAHMGMGAIHRGLKDLDSAVEAYQRAVRYDPTLSEAWAGLAASWLGQNRPNEAKRVCRDAIKNVPSEADAYLTLAMLAPEESELILLQAVRNVPGDPRTHAAQGARLLVSGQPVKALAAAETALAIEGTNPQALRTRMFARSMVAGNLDDAGFKSIDMLQGSDDGGRVAEWDALVVAYPKSSLPLMGRASVTAREELSGALVDLSLAVRLEPDNEEALASYGLVLLEARRFDEALVMLRKATMVRPRDASLNEALARAAAATGDIAFATTKLEEVIAERPDRVNSVVLLAGIMSESGDKEAAYALLRGAVGRNRDATLALALAGAARDIGRVLEAADILEALGNQLGSAQMLESAKNLREHHAASEP